MSATFRTRRRRLTRVRWATGTPALWPRARRRRSRSPNRAIIIISARRTRGCTGRSSSNSQKSLSRPLLLPRGGSRQPHTEQWGGRLRRQPCVIARYFEQRGVLRADLDVAQFPANRRNLAFVGCESGITLHRDAVLAQPQRADGAPLRRFLVHL